MRNTEQTLNTAIGELRCLDPDKPTSLDELTALSAARDCIDELLRSCVKELRSSAPKQASWSDIAYALGSGSAHAVKQRYGAQASTTKAEETDQVLAFWRLFATRFVWDFLPTGFLHALYSCWMITEFPEESPLSKEALTRRLRAAVEQSGTWFYTRSRPGALMNVEEPLTKLVPHWSHDGSDAAIYGLRRSKTLRNSSA